jgi:histidyl-tRNA synthetase
LDYYTRTTFEFVHGSLGAQNSLLGGGRYDGLSEQLGGPPAPGIGFSIGEDRLALTIGEEGSPARESSGALAVYVAWMGESAFAPAAELARTLRRHGVPTELAPEDAKLKKSLELASRLPARYALIVGERELADRRYPLRDLSRGRQQSYTEPELLELLAPRSAAAPLALSHAKEPSQ